ncbi:tRNA (mnm(5)s(2)U34)-methyltransferase [Geoalkalibacter subterraneus]|uniref:tRNA (mnm(5)s(2)U34)-methyltransferase n=1 Tax=Geoalkalibacter subterraneus TaxID=483547 RepID=UPI00130E6BAA|nr:class I SAM-dependent methyltransferase [Geoalkalibacter subterraneus]
MSSALLLPLTRIVPWSQSLLAEVLATGDLAVDLTAGAGRDTLFLWQQVAPSGSVVAFDVQEAALERTRLLLQAEGVPVFLHSYEDPGSFAKPGVHLIHDSHAQWLQYDFDSPRVVIANLGYLPDGDRSLVTQKDSTLRALTVALRHLRDQGRLAVVGYPGHEGGQEEVEAVGFLLSGLDPERWQVLHLRAANCPQAPLLWVAEKKAA